MPNDCWAQFLKLDKAGVTAKSSAGYFSRKKRASPRKQPHGLLWLCLFFILKDKGDLPGCNLCLSIDVRQVEVGKPWKCIILSDRRSTGTTTKDRETGSRPSRRDSQGKLLEWEKGVLRCIFIKCDGILVTRALLSFPLKNFRVRLPESTLSLNFFIIGRREGTWISLLQQPVPHLLSRKIKLCSLINPLPVAEWGAETDENFSSFNGFT